MKFKLGDRVRVNDVTHLAYLLTNEWAQCTALEQLGVGVVTRVESFGMVEVEVTFRTKDDRGLVEADMEFSFNYSEHELELVE